MILTESSFKFQKVYSSLTLKCRIILPKQMQKIPGRIILVRYHFSVCTFQPSIAAEKFKWNFSADARKCFQLLKSQTKYICFIALPQLFHSSNNKFTVPCYNCFVQNKMRTILKQLRFYTCILYNWPLEIDVLHLLNTISRNNLQIVWFYKNIYFTTFL